MTVKELVEKLEALDPQKEIVVCVKDSETLPENPFNIYHKGKIDTVAFRFNDDAAQGVFVIEAEDTFAEYVRK